MFGQVPHVAHHVNPLYETMSQYSYNVNNELAETSVSSLVQPPHYEDLEFIEFYDNYPSDESVQDAFLFHLQKMSCYLITTALAPNLGAKRQGNTIHIITTVIGT